MPQASHEQREEWGGEWTGDYDEHGARVYDGSIGMGKACDYLEDRGFRLTADWGWTLPPGRPIYEVTEKEFGAIDFLIAEWDFGGVEVEVESTEPEVKPVTNLQAALIAFGVPFAIWGLLWLLRAVFP